MPGWLVKRSSVSMRLGERHGRDDVYDVRHAFAHLQRHGRHRLFIALRGLAIAWYGIHTALHHYYSKATASRLSRA
jgi:hypothetical protein